MVPTILRRILEDGGMDDLAVCLYSLNTTGECDGRPLFFYHLEKNGGIGVHTALLAAHDMAEYLATSRKIYLRFHASDDEFDDCLSTVRQSDVRAVAYVGKVGIRTYGVHESLGHPWRLMTLLRDPFDRLVSFYFYQIRRSARWGPASADDFMKFVNDPVNRNYQCKMLSALGANEECDDKDAYDEARANLEQFDWVGKTSDMEEILLGVWSTYGFLPFLSQRIHRNPHKKDKFEHLRDDVYEINRHDVALFDHVAKNPRNPFNIAPENESRINLGPIFSVVLDSNRDDAGRWWTKCAPTPTMLEFAQQKGGAIKDLYEMLPDTPTG